MPSYLELIPGIGVERTVIIEDVDEVEFVSNPNFVIVWVMRRSNLDGPSPELHVNHRIGYNWHPPINKWVGYEFAVQVLS